MDEAEWLTCQEPQKMLEFLHGKVSDRKLRLFAVACCRLLWHLVQNEGYRKIVELAEQLADGETASRTLSQARKQARDGALTASGIERMWANAIRGCISDQRQYVEATADAAVNALTWSVRAWASAEYQAKQTQVTLLRCVFKPFHPVTLNPTWLTATVTDLATSIYAGRSYDQMPILADALEEAGCSSVELLRHLRSAGPHVRGCFALDALLGKE